MTVTSSEHDHAERWRQWQLRNAAISSRAATHARIMFAVVLTAVGAWLALQLLAV